MERYSEILQSEYGRTRTRTSSAFGRFSLSDIVRDYRFTIEFLGIVTSFIDFSGHRTIVFSSKILTEPNSIVSNFFVIHFTLL